MQRMNCGRSFPIWRIGEPSRSRMVVPYTMMSKLQILLTAAVMAVLSACGGKPAADPPGHEAWTALLQARVDSLGVVDYPGMIRDSSRLNAYLDALSAHHPDPDTWSEPEQMAYWINAYNAFTVRLIIRNYPVESIKDLGPPNALPFVNTVWDASFIRIGGYAYTLNRIEHRELRHAFKDPRIHFALVCASRSCPPLRREAYTAEKLEAQLEDQAHAFIQGHYRNKPLAHSPRLSPIFKWYAPDFTEGVIPFLNNYLDEPIPEDAELQWLEYDWRLNNALPEKP